LKTKTENYWDAVETTSQIVLVEVERRGREKRKNGGNEFYEEEERFVL
jgi:hypothetical protein